MAGPGILAAAVVAVLTLCAEAIKEHFHTGNLSFWLAQHTLFDICDATFFRVVLDIEGRTRGVVARVLDV